MSNIRWIAAFAASLAFLFAAPQGDAPGVTVDLNGAALLHRAPVNWPERARTLRGAVVVDVVLDAAGNVSDARVLSGPEELRRNVLQSVLQWHFAAETAGMHRQVTVSFEPAAPGEIKASPAGRQTNMNVLNDKIEELRRTAQAVRAKQDAAVRTVRNISVVGLAEPSRTELLNRLSVHQGDSLDAAGRERVLKAAKEFDEHLDVFFPPAGPEGDISVQIVVPNFKPADAATVPGRIRVGGNIMQGKLVAQPHPVYPAEAKAQRIQGVVKLQAVIANNGTLLELEVLSGHPLLAPAALEAVRQWVYAPTLLNGNPVEVITQIDVNFTLSQ